MARSHKRVTARKSSKSSGISLKTVAIGLVSVVVLGSVISGPLNNNKPVESNSGIAESAVLDEVLPEDALATDERSSATPEAPAVSPDGSAASPHFASGVVAIASGQSGASSSQAVASPEVEVDKSQLEGAIVEAWAVDGAQYTEESYVSMRGVLDAVSAVYTNPGATQEEVAQAVGDLRQSMGGLVVWTPPVVEPEPVVENVPIGRVVYIADTGKKYHSNGCRYLNKSKTEISYDDAVARGYTACKVCGG